MLQLNARQAALLIVDMQVGLFQGPQQPYEAERLVATVKRLIGKARSAQVPVFAVRHTGPAGSPIAAGSGFWQVLPELGLEEGVDHLFNKSAPSCFQGTDLAQRFGDAGVKEVVVVGLKTQYCVDSTCRAALELGFKPVLVADGHSCMDTEVMPAAAIIAHHNLTLGGPTARVVGEGELAFV
ncbi:MAG: cysteine hydrolase family protein [Pseudomonas sp.]|uniref:cysteine hydrolase family protein n=1 Tax=Pseudomonas abieticivorans TaxID=2931382 RepID=UPI0020BDCE2F|nr:cysteine hydrolase family protein [Pseudomonas sp. PIA16]MDE1166575.1 cysteine hydrolase family protein [Pseudomonas sp.]